MTPLRIGAAAAVVAMAGLATGDVLVAAVLVGVVLGDAVAGVAAVLAAAAVLVRWGTTSLGGIGGDQAVLGWAGSVGSWTVATASWCAAGALVVLPSRRARSTRSTWPAAVACGALAAFLVAGPTDPGGWWIRVVATALAGGAALVAARTLPRRAGLALSLAGAVLALALAVVA